MPEHHAGDAHRTLDEQGTPIGDSVDVPDPKLLAIYEDMRLTRTLDRRMVSLQRQGRIPNYPPSRGQEAAQIGSAHAMAEDDWLFPAYREPGAMHVRGVDVEKYLQFWMGYEAGNHRPEGSKVFSLSLPVGSHVPHATGMGLGLNLRGIEDRAVLCYFGDGATSTGDFHAGLNFAGVYDTPNVFFCNNNQWAISTPIDLQTGSETIAQKAEAYGFEGVRVDGMDPVAVYEVTRRAIEKAKDPGEDEKKPTLVEAYLYRLAAHSTSDDPSRYRDEETTEEWREKDPIDRLRSFLVDTGRLTEEEDESIGSKVEERVDEAVEAAESVTADPDEMFEHVYAEQTAHLRNQQAELRRFRERHGDGGSEP